MLKVLSLGAGVQSSTVLLMSCAGELPKLDAAIFADTGWEPRPVYAYLNWLKGCAEDCGIPIYIVSAGSIKDPKFAYRMPLFIATPNGTGMVLRACTGRLKIEPVQAKTKELLGLTKRQRWPKTPAVERWFGISKDELRRARLSSDNWAINRYPLIEDIPMSRADCLAWCRENGYQIPSRSACLCCPYHSDREWRYIKDHYPEDFAEVVAFEKRLQADGGTYLDGTPYLHRSLVPIGEVDLRTSEELGQGNLFVNECSGMCGV